MSKLIIKTANSKIKFNGIYRRDLETKNWHYYEKENGKLIHIRKDKMEIVEEI